MDTIISTWVLSIVLLLIIVNIIIVRSYPRSSWAKKIRAFLNPSRAQEKDKPFQSTYEPRTSDRVATGISETSENRVAPLDYQATANNQPPDDMRNKKEKARELYYKKLYEEVTKFNISTENLDYESLQMLADSHAKIGNKAEAIKIYDMALERATHNILKDKAITLFSMEAYEDAFRVLQQYNPKYLHEDIMQDDFSLLGILSKCYIHFRDYEKAIELLRPVVISNPRVSKDMIYNLASLYERRNTKEDLQEALELYEKIYLVEAGFKDVREKMNRLMNQLL
ncbi:MAG: hypothetical protein EAZ55_10135 [Cytophagales bacterium]|nr:MAG: hypothetical protein EAZ55_10135 [Cytophagales bacterium]